MALNKSVPPGKQDSKKRKDPPSSANSSKPNDKRPKTDHRSKQREARSLVSQTTSKAFKHGELDVDKFVKAREFEVRALEEGLNRSRTALNKRAFQQVPKDLRRRSASHNVKKIPKRLRARGKKEMLEDNTPTVTSRRRKPTRHMRLRLETAKKLRALGSKRKAERNAAKAGEVTVTAVEGSEKTKPASTAPKTSEASVGIKTRAPKIKKAQLATPPVPKAKFRKRQIHKSWLPTHMYHAKRARMTPPSDPLWRFAMPLTPTAKGYRPTHRANTQRGAVAWDMSYVSTIGLEGREESITCVLRGLGIGLSEGEDVHAMYGPKGLKWRSGLRAFETPAYEQKDPRGLIAPVTTVWCAQSEEAKAHAHAKRQLFLRVHPSAFFKIWEEINQLAKVAKPQVSVEDLRFEIGSIEISGPGSTEALLGSLWPSATTQDTAMTGTDEGPPTKSVEETWTKLAGLGNPALLPAGASLGFNIQDPRLHHPPRTIKLPSSDAEQSDLVELTANWPADTTQNPQEIFDRRARLTASRALPSQKSINRRKTLAKPGEYPESSPKDPKIPMLAFVSSDFSNKRQSSHQATWTILLPWKCVQPAWCSTMFYPLSTGQQPRLGGLDEKQQLSFEIGRPWFPADFPGTHAGWEWELKERKKRFDEWNRRPKGKRTIWEKVELGDGKKGEVGSGWACDWEKLLDEPVKSAKENAQPSTSKPLSLTHITALHAQSLLTSPSPPPPSALTSLLSIRLTVYRGVPFACARIYRLPSSPEHRKEWLALQPSALPGSKKIKSTKAPLPRLPKNAPPHLAQQRLAASLLEPPKAGEEGYPSCPGEEDLIGFVTSGNFNLGEGRGMGVGCVVFGKVFEGVKGADGKEERLCVVRNAGNGVARLARWDMA